MEYKWKIGLNYQKLSLHRFERTASIGSGFGGRKEPLVSVDDSPRCYLLRPFCFVAPAFPAYVSGQACKSRQQPKRIAELVWIDFFTVPTVTFRVLFVLLVLSHHRRRGVYFIDTRSDTRFRDSHAIRLPKILLLAFWGFGLQNEFPRNLDPIFRRRD